MKYAFDETWTLKSREIAQDLEFNHILLDRISCLKSNGSQSRRTIARIHTMPKVIQIGMNHLPAYVIELISEKFDRQSEDEKIKTIIHELMHIPHSFNGGFRQHRPFVTHAKVDENFKKWQEKQHPKGVPTTTIVPNSTSQPAGQTWFAWKR